VSAFSGEQDSKKPISFFCHVRPE